MAVRTGPGRPAAPTPLEIAAGNVLRVTTTHPDCRPALHLPGPDVHRRRHHLADRADSHAHGQRERGRARAGRPLGVRAGLRPHGRRSPVRRTRRSTLDRRRADLDLAGRTLPAAHGADGRVRRLRAGARRRPGRSPCCASRVSPGHDPFVATSSQRRQARSWPAPRTPNSAHPSPPPRPASSSPPRRRPGPRASCCAPPTAGKTWTVVVTAPATSTFGGIRLRLPRLRERHHRPLGVRVRSLTRSGRRATPARPGPSTPSSAG